MSLVYTTTIRCYRVSFLLCLLLALLAGAGHTEPAPSVSVSGIDGRLKENVLARLRINIFRLTQLSGTEIERLHRLAEEDIASALEPFGYYDPTVQGRLTFGDGSWQAAYVIDPGAPVLVSEVQIEVRGEGAGLPELANPAATFPLQRGAVLDHRLYEEGKKTVLRRARSLGLLDAAYGVHEIRVDRTNRHASLRLRLDTGRRYQFGRVLSDQQIIDPELLERFLPFQQGEPFSRRLLQEVQRDLYRTDYFGSVRVVADLDNVEDHAIPVIIEAEPPEHYNRYSVGIGWATDIGAHLRFERNNRLLNKRGHRLNGSLLIGELKSYGLLNYRVPVADPRFDSLVTSGLWDREQWEDIRTERLSTGLAFEHAQAEYLYGISLEALNESYRIGETRDSAVLIMPGIKGSLAWADDVVNTENGVRLSVEGTGASEQLLSDASFVKVRGDGKLIVSPLPDWRLIGSGAVGAILVDDIEDIPPSLRFYAGGEKSVRGYQYRSLGPVDERGSVIGGRLLLTGSVEIERRLGRYWRMAAFYDAGNAMDDLEVDLAHGVGIGLGFALPFGQVRLDVAYPLDDQGSTQSVFLSVGADL